MNKYIVYSDEYYCLGRNSSSIQNSAENKYQGQYNLS